MKDLNKAINEYLLYVATFKAKGTYTSEKYGLEKLRKFLVLEGITNIYEINQKLIYDWINWMKLSVNNKTINEYVHIVKKFLRHHEIHDPKIESIKKLKVVVVHRDIVYQTTREKLFSFFDNLDLDVNNHLLWKGLFYITLYTGARIDELLNVKKKDVNLKEKLILLRNTKTKKERLAPYHEKISNIVESIYHNSECDYLFYNKLKNRRANYGDVRYMYKTIKRKLNIDTLYSHMLRHTIATELIEHGADMAVVQDLLGHADIKTTRIYARVSNKRMISEYHKHVKF